MLPVSAASGLTDTQHSHSVGNGFADWILLFTLTVAMAIGICTNKGLIKPLHVFATSDGLSDVLLSLACVWGAFALFFLFVVVQFQPCWSVLSSLPMLCCAGLFCKKK